MPLDALTLTEMMLLLRNRQTAPELLRRIARDGGWTRRYPVRRGLVLHPRTPSETARKLVPELFWKDLAEAAEQPALHPTVRELAENTLLARVDDLTLGERITLARIGGPGVIARLVDSPEPRVLSSLLGNSKILERDAIKLACRSDAPESFLQKLAEHRWGQVREVRLGLIRNPRTPIPAALRLLGTLPASDLRRVAKDAKVRRLLRLSADRALPGAPPSRESP